MQKNQAKLQVTNLTSNINLSFFLLRLSFVYVSFNHHNAIFNVIIVVVTFRENCVERK